MDISTRANKLPSSPMRAFTEIVAATEAKGTQVIKLNIGQPDIETPTEFWDLIDNDRPKTVSYAASAGICELREAIAKDYHSYGVSELNKENVIVTVGASEAVGFALQACVDSGGEVLIPEPFYANYMTLASMYNVKVVPLKTDYRQGFALPALSGIEAALTPKTQAIMIANPDNPTGKVYTRKELRDLLKLAAERNLWLIVDEVYKDFVFSPAKFVSALEVESKTGSTNAPEPRVVVLDSISKKFSACGARIGAVISRNSKFIAACNKYAMSRLSAGVVDQLGALGLYQADMTDYLRTEIRDRYQARKQVLERELARIPGVEVPNVSGAFYLFIRLPVANTWKFTEWLLKDFPEIAKTSKTLLIAPGTGFFIDPEDGQQFARIAYVLEEGKLVEAASILEEALELYQRSEN